jgi:hypothetical protein
MVTELKRISMSAETCFRACRNDLTVGCCEAECVVFAGLNTKATLVHQPVMITTQQYQVIQAGFPAIGPVLYVVDIYKAVTGAATGRSFRPSWPIMENTYPHTLQKNLTSI